MKRRCILCQTDVDINRFIPRVQICMTCENALVPIMTLLDEGIKKAEAEFTERFANLSFDDATLMSKVMDKYKEVWHIAQPQLRKGAYERLDAKTEKTIQNRSDAFGLALKAWYHHRTLHERFQSVMFYSLALRNGEFDEWVKQYAKRQNG